MRPYPTGVKGAFSPHQLRSFVDIARAKHPGTCLVYTYVEGLRDYVMNTDGTRRTHAQDLIERHDHVRIDNTRLSPAETAALILRRMPQ
ncbi:hypothetical protein [Amycolatopsis sp. NPDC049868]|uniref:hypothetical protein n=1 Tax=Amycolatopsis sp. NPDC049868 TaxID=3363934 RepID=UPI0037903690